MKLGWKMALILLAVLVAGSGIAFGVIYLRYNGEVRVTDRGVVAGDPQAAGANTKALNRMLLFAHKGTTLVFEPGDYYVAAGKTGGLTLFHKNGVTLKGEEGVTLINTTYSPYKLPGDFAYMDSGLINIVGGRDIRIEGLAFDYRAVTSVTGVITKSGGGLLAFRPNDEYLSGETALETDGFAVCVNLFDENGVPGQELWLADNTTLTQSADNPEEFWLPADFGKVGQTVSVRFTCWQNTAPTVSIDGVTGLTVRDVRVLSTPSACFFCYGDGEDYTFENITVASPEGSGALFSANGDGIHLQGLRGKLTVRNCRFVGLGDDALNIHVRAPLVTAVADGKLTLDYAENEPATGFARAGDRVELYTKAGERLGETTVTAVKKNVVTLEETPSGTAEGVLLNNLSRQPETLVDGCSVQRGRARGLLLETTKATVTNSTFRDLRGPGVLIAPDLAQWHELGPCREAVLDGNTFVNCCTDASAGNWGAVTVTVGHDRPPFRAPKIHGSVTLTNNDISDTPTAILLNGVPEDKVTLTDNRVGDGKVLQR